MRTAILAGAEGVGDTTGVTRVNSPDAMPTSILNPVTSATRVAGAGAGASPTGKMPAVARPGKPGVIGRMLTEDERFELIEYLKTL